MATKVYIVYYYMYGHVEKLAEEIQKGAASVEGVEAKLWQVPETLPEEVLTKMSASSKSDTPVITPEELAEADGFIFGFPTRFGMMAAQFKAFFDATGGLWRTQQLAGKPAGIFYSTGSQGGDQETTALTAITQLVDHGMIFVPMGYISEASMFEMEKVKGGRPYGAGTYAGDGSRQPSELETEQAFHQGKYIAAIAKNKYNKYSVCIRMNFLFNLLFLSDSCYFVSSDYCMRFFFYQHLLPRPSIQNEIIYSNSLSINSSDL